MGYMFDPRTKSQWKVRLNMENYHSIGPSDITCERLTPIYAAFWAEQSRILDERFEKLLLGNVINDEIGYEYRRGVPPGLSRGVNQIAEDVHRIYLSIVRNSAQKGGLAAKSDPLQMLIERWVASNPRMTALDLENRLRRHVNIDPITDIDGDKICFTLPDDRMKSAPFSGLKDRLSRAKKKIYSR